MEIAADRISILSCRMDCLCLAFTVRVDRKVACAWIQAFIRLQGIEQVGLADRVWTLIDEIPPHIYRFSDVTP